MAINSYEGVINETDKAFGGAIAHETNSFYWGSSSFKLANCDFVGNAAEGQSNNYGGAVYYQGAYNILAPDPFTVTDCIFIANYVSSGTTSQGGAIYHTGSNPLQVIVKNRNSYFLYNKVNAEFPAVIGTVDDIPSYESVYGDFDAYVNSRKTPVAGKASAIYFAGSAKNGDQDFLLDYDFKALARYDQSNATSLTLLHAALSSPDLASFEAYAKDQSGSTLLFFDPVDFQQQTLTNIHFNRPDADGTSYEGRIVFTGMAYQGTDAVSIASRTSTANQKISFKHQNGVVQIADGAILGAKEASATPEAGVLAYDFARGELEILRNGHLLATTITTNADNGSYKDVVLRTDGTSRLTADTFDITRGVTIDFMKAWVSNPEVKGINLPTGLLVQANTISLGGSLGITDTHLLDFYMDPRWNYTQHFLVTDLVNADETHFYEGAFDAAVSQKYDLSDLTGIAFYDGRWETEIVDGKLYAVWVSPNGEQPDNPIPPEPDSRTLDPELAGDHILNSMWSTRSNMRSMSNLGMGQLGYDRYRLKNCWNYWATTIGDFNMQRGLGKRDGFDYDGFGYAVGGDARFCPRNYVLGVAFGNLFGKNNSRHFNARINQTSLIGMVYGGWLKEFDKTNALNITGTASYGITENRLKTYYSDGLRSNGKWDNNAMRFTLKAEWQHGFSRDWLFAPFIGLEYDDITQKAFTESGDRPRHFGRGKLRNLAMLVGSAITKQNTFTNGWTWINSFSAAYLPDIYRDNPHDTVTRLTQDGYSWTGRGMNTARNAGRFEYSTRLIFNPSWSLFSGYTIEVRKNGVYQQAILGVSASF